MRPSVTHALGHLGERLERLVNAHKRLFALRVCEAVGIWACARIPADECTTDDVVLKDIIVDKLSDWDGIRYATIVQHAQTGTRPKRGCCSDVGLRSLCSGPSAVIGALDRAVESGDTDLVYLSIFHLYKKASRSQRVLEVLQGPGCPIFVAPFFWALLWRSMAQGEGGTSTGCH
ncbi:hypothetical protein BSKO_00214 [Bryopsis sp. KO-2023]|nr:hypothetical protein BSKO_00214 [Bryopsis sp. KO-2023]